jgi:hypothetical protein
MNMNVRNPDEVGDRKKRENKKLLLKVVTRHPLSHNEDGMAHIIRDIRIHFLRYESPYYGTEINQDTGKCYMLEAKRKFTKYYLEHIAEFYGACHDN